MITTERLVWCEVYLPEVDDMIVLPYIPSYAAIREIEKGCLHHVGAARAREINSSFTERNPKEAAFFKEKMNGRLAALEQNMADLRAEIDALAK